MGGGSSYASQRGLFQREALFTFNRVWHLSQETHGEVRVTVTSQQYAGRWQLA